MNLVFRTYRPYGAPLAVFRGAATRDPAVKAVLRDAGCRWDSRMHGWATYTYEPETIAQAVVQAVPEVTVVAGDDES